MSDTPRLSKSRFVAGVQCHKLLWWRVHEPDATELQPGKVLQDLFDQGQAVGAAATERFPGGVLIDHPHRAYADRLSSTQAALASEPPAIFEAAFTADGTFVAVDVLRKGTDGFDLIEVKSSSGQKPEHIPDVAVQKYVLEANGLPVRQCAVMHLNRDNRYPSTDDLFALTDVTTPVDAYLPEVPREIERQRTMLTGPLPEVLTTSVPNTSSCAWIMESIRFHIAVTS